MAAKMTLLDSILRKSSILSSEVEARVRARMSATFGTFRAVQ